MLFYLDRFMEIVLLPPGCIILLALIGFLFWRSRPVFGKFLVTFSIISLWLLSTPLVAQQLIDKLQYKYPTLEPDKLAADKASAIVVLEAGLNLNTPEYRQTTVSESTLARIKYAAFLHQKTGAAVLLSGNDPSHPTIDQTDYMARALKEYFGVPTQWKENRGYNTATEGIYTAEILKKDGLKKIYLVTHALHMPRAVYAFHNRGLEVIPAPTGYKKLEHTMGKLTDFMPSTEALSFSSAALREYIGISWYYVHYRF